MSADTRSVASLLDELRFNGRAHFTQNFRHALADRIADAITADYDRVRALHDAEIVRLRGENLRQANAAYSEGMARELLAIAPAEAKGDLSSRMYRGPSHPDTERANLLDRRSIAEESPQPADGGAVAHGVVKAGVRDADGEFHIKCRFADGQKFAAVIVDGDHEKLAHAIADFLTHPPAAQVQPRPSDDELWDQTLQERDRYHDTADELAALIASITGEEIGEHSSANCPWENAKEAAVSYISESAAKDAHKAAQVQGEAVDTLALRMLVAAGHVSQKLMDQSRSIARGVLPGPLDEATHPAGDALGAVEIDEAMIERGCKAIAPPVMLGEQTYRSVTIAVLEAALQHRGDSQEVGRG